MERRYAKKGLTIIAPEVQGSAADAIQTLVKEHKIEYTVTQGITGPRLGNGIPHMAVFDGSGKLIWVGHPMSGDAEDAIRDALKTARPAADGAAPGGLGRKKTELLPVRTWTNAEGRQIEAALIAVDGTMGHFKFPNGKAFDYELSKLSPADQEAIQAARAAAAPAKPSE